MKNIVHYLQYIPVEKVNWNKWVEAFNREMEDRQTS